MLDEIEERDLEENDVIIKKRKISNVYHPVEFKNNFLNLDDDSGPYLWVVIAFIFTG